MSWLDRINPQVHVAGALRQRWTWRDAPRQLRDHEFMLFGTGFSGDISWEGGRFLITGEDWVIIPPGLVHTCTGSGPGAPHRSWVHFDWDYIDDTRPWPVMTYLPSLPPEGSLRLAPSWLPMSGIQSGQAVGYPALRDVHLRLIAAWNAGDQGLARALLLELLTRLFASRSDSASEVDSLQQLALRVREALDELALHPFADAPAISATLLRLGRSADHCTRAFRAVFGIPPTRYLIAQRMHQAQALLREGMSPVDVARRLGFSDPGYFNRLFRHYAGQAPGAWQRQQPPLTAS